MDSANKKGMHHMVKFLTFWDKDENFLYMCQLYTYTAWGTNNLSAKTVHYSLEKVDANDSKIIFHGTATDVGGGGVSDRLVD